MNSSFGEVIYVNITNPKKRVLESSSRFFLLRKGGIILQALFPV